MPEIYELDAWQIADKVRIEVSRAAIGGYQGQTPVVEPEAASESK